MDKNSELVKNTAIIAFGKICTQLISFLLLPLYTSVLKTEEYGIVDLIFTYCSLLLPIATLALEQAVFRYLIDVRENETKKANCISSCFYGVLFITILLIGIDVIVYLILRNIIVILFMLVLLSTSFSTLFLQICRGLGDNVGYSLAGVITAVVQISGNVFFLVLFDMGAKGMILASFMGNFACIVFLLIRCKLGKYIRFADINKKVLKECIWYSLPLIPNQLSWWILNASDRVIVQFFIGVSGNGLMAVANKFSNVYLQLINVFNISWTESAATHIKDEDSNEFFHKIVNTSISLFLCFCFGIIACMPFVFSIMVDYSYMEAYNLIPLFLIAAFFNAIVGIYGVIYVAYKDTVEIMKTAMMSAAINVVSHLILIKFCGLYAAAISSMLGFGYMSVYRYFHSRKYLTVKVKKSTFLLGMVLMLVTLPTYYVDDLWLHIISLFFAIMISFWMNKEVIINLTSSVLNKRKL